MFVYSCNSNNDVSGVYDSIELPADATTVTEVSMEDVLGAMLGALIMGAGMAE